MRTIARVIVLLVIAARNKSIAVRMTVFLALLTDVLWLLHGKGYVKCRIPDKRIKGESYSAIT